MSISSYAIQISLSQPDKFPLHWDNIKAPPFWVEGKYPNVNQGIYQVKLEEPNDFVTIWLAEGAWLRIRYPEKAFPVDALTIAISNGTGLYVDMPTYPAEDGKSLLLIPDLKKHRLVRIRLAEHQEEAVTMALFTSIHKNYYQFHSQYQDIPLSTDKQSLQFDFSLHEENYWYLEKHSPVILKVQGPTQVFLENRFIYPKTESALLQPYHISIRLDENQQPLLKFETTVDKQSINIHGIPVVLGRTEMTVITIPDGEHELQITSHANLYARLQKPVADSSYLFPKLNQPILSRRDFETLEDIKLNALQLIRDNSHREGGLLGAMSVFEVAKRRLYDPRIRKLAKNLLGRHSFYRNLLPWHKPDNESQIFHHFITYQLRDPSLEKYPFISAEQHLEAYLKRVASAYFTQTGTKQKIYKLPLRTVPSVLRIIVKQHTKQQILFVQFDDESPKRLQVDPNVLEVPKYYYHHAQGEIALKILTEIHNIDENTLISRHQTPGSLIEASTLTLALPPNVQQIKIWQGTEPLHIALQYRAARVYRLNEAAYLEAASHFDSPQALFEYFVSVLGNTPPLKNDAQKDLYNYWLPLIRFLQSHNKRFIATIFPTVHIHLKKATLNRLAKEARKAQADKQWLIALEKWTKVAQGSQNTLHHQAQLARVESLLQLGEVFLAKRLLQGLFLNSTDPIVAQQAFERLLHYYQEWDDKLAQIPLLATAVLRNPSPTLLTQLTQVLIDNGYYDYAFMVGMVLPQRPLMIEQTYRLGWWQSFEDLLQHLSPEKQRLWKGYRSQYKGDYAASTRFWQNLDVKSPLHWKTVDHLVQEYSSAEMIYSLERNKYFYSFISTKKHPVKLRIPGPLRIRLSVRTLHQKDDIQPVDAWVKIQEKNKQHVLRLNNILPSQGLRIVGQTDKRLGHQTGAEYEFGHGLHEINIFSDNRTIAVKVMAEMPRLPVLSVKRDASLDEDIIKQMTLLLWKAEHSPELAQQAVIAGAVLFNNNPQVPKLRALWTALQTNFHWKNVTSIESSAGQYFVTIRGWQPESPSQRLRKTLLKPLTEHEHVITGHRQMGLSMFNLAKTTFELKLQMDDIAYFKPVPMNVVYWIDEQAHQKVKLTPEQMTQKIHFTVPKGEHILYVAINKPVANQFLRLQIKEKGNFLITEYERAYHIATAEEPMVVTVHGPNWLRIDEWHQNEISSHFQEVEEGWQTLTFTPKKGQDSAFLRVHEMATVIDQQPDVQLRYFNVIPDIMPAPIVPIPKLQPISRLDVKDAFPLAEQEKGTWSLTGLAQRRRNVEEEETTFQDFLELRATHRYFDKIKNRHHRTEWLTRRFLNNDGDITLGVRRRSRYRSKKHNLTLQLAGSAYLQKIWGEGIEWHGLLKGTLFKRLMLNEKTFHVPSVGLFGRILSRDDEPDDYDAARLDNDVYSDYKAAHRFGLVLADKITYHPWLDTLWTGRVAITSNENVFEPDYFSLKGVWKQMLGDGQIDFGYRFTHYWADEERNSNINRHFLLLNMNWNILHKNETRWDFGAKLQHDLDNNELLGMLYLSWHGGKRRAYRNIMPGEIDFLNLRKQRIPQRDNNEIIRFWEK